jgi:hypothetical protein
MRLPEDPSHRVIVRVNNSLQNFFPKSTSGTICWYHNPDGSIAFKNH